MNQNRIMRLKEVLKTTGLGRTTLWRWEQTGKFPKRVTIGPKSMGWLSSEIADWLDKQSSQRVNRPICFEAIWNVKNGELTTVKFGGAVPLSIIGCRTKVTIEPVTTNKGTNS